MLYELIYHSCSEIDFTSPLMSDMLNNARRFNQRNDITGCLLCYQGEFLQLIEGDAEVVLNLYRKISRDPRHSHVVVLAQGKIETRAFSHWSMAFQDFSNFALIDNNGLNSEQLNHLLKNLSQTTAARKLFRLVAVEIVSGA